MRRVRKSNITQAFVSSYINVHENGGKNVEGDGVLPTVSERISEEVKVGERLNQLTTN